VAADTAQFVQEMLPEAAGRFRERMNRRAAQNRKEKLADERVLSKLHAVRAPSSVAFLALAVAAFCIDLLDILLTFADVAAFVGTIISVVLNIGMFLAIRSVMNRGPLVSWFLAACIIGVIVASAVPIIGSIAAQSFAMVILVAGVLNPNASAIKGAQEGMKAPLERMGRSIATARQRTAQAIRFARRAGKYSKRLARFTRSFVRSKAFRSVAKGSRALGRMLGGLLANSLPILRFIPFQLLTVWLTYRELKRNHQEAQELLSQYAAASAEEIDALATEAAVLAETELTESAEAAAAQEAAEEQVAAREEVRDVAAETSRPTPVIDIAEPGSPASRIVRPVPRETARAVPPVPMRDVAVAA